MQTFYVTALNACDVIFPIFRSKQSGCLGLIKIQLYHRMSVKEGNASVTVMIKGRKVVIETEYFLWLVTFLAFVTAESGSKSVCTQNKV